jgi:hypothetical protein
MPFLESACLGFHRVADGSPSAQPVAAADRAKGARPLRSIRSAATATFTADGEGMLVEVYGWMRLKHGKAIGRQSR